MTTTTSTTSTTARSPSSNSAGRSVRSVLDLVAGAVAASPSHDAVARCPAAQLCPGSKNGHQKPVETPESRAAPQRAVLPRSRMATGFRH